MQKTRLGLPNIEKRDAETLAKIKNSAKVANNIPNIFGRNNHERRNSSINSQRLQTQQQLNGSSLHRLVEHPQQAASSPKATNDEKMLDEIHKMRLKLEHDKTKTLAEAGAAPITLNKR